MDSPKGPTPPLPPPHKSFETTSQPKQRPILKVFLAGLYDKESHLSKLRGCENIIKAIWTEVRDYYQSAVTDCTFTLNTYRNSYFIDLQKISLPPIQPWEDLNFFLQHKLECTPEFPPPSGININMMPFISSEQFENCRLPKFLAPYWGLITHCVRHEKERNSSSIGKVFYLSIEESKVELGFPQRQPGLHVDRPRLVNIASSQVIFTA